MPQITAGVYFQLQQRDLSALGQYVCSNLGVVQSVHIPGQYVYTICVFVVVFRVMRCARVREVDVRAQVFVYLGVCDFFGMDG